MSSFDDLFLLEFRIPQFMEIDREAHTDDSSSAVSQPTPHQLLLQAQERAEAKVRAHSRAGSSRAGSRIDYNVVQQHQANKLGLKSRDYSQLFQAVTPA